MSKQTLCKYPILALLLSIISIPTFAIGYALTEIPTPNIPIPTGATARPVCLSINEFGQIACNLEIIQTLTRTPVDRLAPNANILASYAYVWDSRTKVTTLLSATSTNRFDHINAISDTSVAGSVAVVGKPSQATIWSIALKNSTNFGQGEITDINDRGDYVLNNQLISNNSLITYSGKNNLVQAINNLNDTSPVLAAGRQNLLAPVKISGLGLLYLTAPSNPLFALISSLSSYSINDLSDDGKRFVLSGLPNTISSFISLSCIAPQNCQFYFANVDFTGRAKPYIRLNSIDNNGHAVGTDGGVAILINPPTNTALNGTRIDLNSQLPLGSFSKFGWFLNEAIGINSSGIIVGVGLKGGKNVAFLLSPI